MNKRLRKNPTSTLPSERVRAGLMLRRMSVPKLAQKHGVPAPSLYAVIAGRRPGVSDKMRRALAEAKQAADALERIAS